MFEVPQAKRVRRADFDAPNNSDSETDDEGYDAEWQARLNAQIARSLGITENYAQPQTAVAKQSHSTKARPADDDSELHGSSDGAEDDTTEGQENAGDEEFAFRLFSNAKPAQKVVLEEDAGPTGDGTFATKRPLSYYMVTNLTETQKQQYAMAAVTGEGVVARSRDRSWGLELPWKVTNISITRKLKPGEPGTTTVEEEGAKKKRRPGKKQRISLRKRARTKEEMKQVAAQKAVEKEEHMKEKKKRLNRIKKLRKRAKDKEAKAAANGGEDGDDDSE
ncbi:hypothetical protein B0T10DRAFT_285645 [Thelonectria olida]|uniref:Uncharacterized protein n=1 Tax=Thelonectria olida TaxID=1576542 RepID=A0A9P9AQW1_9HYPO|nr:hypothetical protein B0T10DRAFT_285645 [Thelonectria olida]